jgi:hypothetical protein
MAVRAVADGGRRASAAGTNTRMVGVDAGGREWPIDYRAWQPLGFDELNPWMHRTFPLLDAAARDRVARYLLGVAERARRRSRAGGESGIRPHSRPARGALLRPPPADLVPGAGAPPEVFERLRVYRERWDHEERRRDPRSVTRALIHEYPRP